MENYSTPEERFARVLVVDDNPSNCRLLSNYLAATHFEVNTAYNGFEALQSVSEAPPDIILLDIMMPEMNGFEVCTRLKEKPETSEIPVIFFSAQAETDDKLRGFSLGAVDYVTKPVKKSEIIARIRTHLTIRFQKLDLQKMNQELTELTEALKRREIQLEAANNALERMARYDSLTELCNRRYFFELALTHWEASTNEASSMSMLMVDIDFFKQFNDTYGHQQGDECLRTVAKCIQDSFTQEGQLAARYGGEEFIVLLANTSTEDAVRLAQAVCDKVHEQAIPNRANFSTGHITISVGVATGGTFKDSIVEDLIARADIALYQAKQNGRNCVLKYHEGMKHKAEVPPPEPV